MKVEIIHNAERNGIELKFSEKPSGEILLRLKEAGFSYSEKFALWWTKHSKAMGKFSEALKEALEKGEEHFTVLIEPTYAPSDENIDLKNYSFVSISFKGNNGKQEIENFLVFEPSKNAALLIARNFAEEKFGEALKTVKIYPKTYLKKARLLYKEGKIIESKTSQSSKGAVSGMEEEREIDKATPETAGFSKEEESKSNYAEELLNKNPKRYVQLLQPYSGIYRKLERLIPDFEEHLEKGTPAGKSKLNSSGMMDLNYDYLGKMPDGSHHIALGHYFEQNGDMVPDPDMEIRVDSKMKVAEALQYQDQFGFKPVYVMEDGKQLVNLHEKKSQNSFLSQWLTNVLQQGHQIKMQEEEIENPIKENSTVMEEKNSEEEREENKKEESLNEKEKLENDLLSYRADKLRAIKQTIWNADPNDKGLQKLVAYFVGKEVYPEVLLGVYFNKEGIVATDAQKLLFLNAQQSKFKGLYCMSHQCWKNIRVDKKDGDGLTEAEQKQVDAFRDEKRNKYPDYKHVVDVDLKEIFSINAEDLLKYISALKESEIIQSPHYQMAIKAGDIYLGMSGEFLLSGIKSMLSLGYKDLEYAIVTQDKLTVLTPAGKMDKIKTLETDFVLLMPQILHEQLENGKLKEKIIYYDLEKQRPFISEAKEKSEEVNNKKEERKEVDVSNMLIPEDIKEPFSFGNTGHFDVKKLIKKSYPHFLLITAGNIGRQSAKTLFELMQLGYPQDFDLTFSRVELMNVWRKNGKKLFRDLGYPVDENYPYINLYAGYRQIYELSTIIGKEGSEERDWWKAVESFRPVADLEKAVEILEEIIRAKKYERKTYLKTEQLGEDKSDQLKDVEGALRGLSGSLQVIQSYLNKRSNPSTASKMEAKEIKVISSKPKSQHELNESIEKFIREKDASNESYSEEDKQYIIKYTGAGGLIKQGAEGEGILYEYYTPDDVVKKMWGLVYKYGYGGGPVLEPACGIGRFLKYDPYETVAFEVNEVAARITQILYPHVQVHNAAFETNFFKGNVNLGKYTGRKYELIIGNPPYGEFSGKWAGMGEKIYTGTTEYDQYFILRGLEMLSPGGLLVFIVPSAFLQNGVSYNKVKERIDEMAELVDAFRLPTKIFDTTDIGTDIIVLKRR